VRPLTLHRRRSLCQLPVEESPQQDRRRKERQHLKDARGRIPQHSHKHASADDAELMEKTRGIPADVLERRGGREEGREEVRNRLEEEKSAEK